MKYELKANLPHKDYIYNILKERGVGDPQLYLNIDELVVNDFLLLDNIVTGVELLADHIRKKSNIFLIVDSDSDGYTSAAIIYLYIKSIDSEAKIDFGIHKGKQHGILIDMIPEDTNLLIVPDAGSNDFEQHKELKEMGIDILVLDHHIAERESEDAVVVNNQLSERYPNKDLSGAGVTYRFCECYDSIYGLNHADNMIDLVAVGLVSDMMDLRNLETRFFVKKGLSNIQNVGLKTFIKKQAYSIGDTDRITPTDIAFYITPLINAIVRVGTQEEKHNMFLAFVDGNKPLKSTKRGAVEGDIETAAEQTARVATNARNRQNKIKEDAIGRLELKIQKHNLLDNKVLFVRLEEDDNFPSELNGLIAMQLSAKYKKPTIVARLGEDDCIKGSARGLNRTSLDSFKDFLEETSMFEYAQGHDNAFGLSIQNCKLEAFHEYANKQLEDYDFEEQTYYVDYIFENTDGLAEAIMEIGQQDSLWGQGVEEPLFVIEDLLVFSSDLQVMGANKTTSKFTKGGVSFIRFRDSSLIEQLKANPQSIVTIVGKARINEWLGEFTPQIYIESYTIQDATTAF